MRKYGRDVAFEVETPVSARELKNRLSATFGWDEALLASSAVASESSVLADDAVLTRSAEIAILPPVCGG